MRKRYGGKHSRSRKNQKNMRGLKRNASQENERVDFRSRKGYIRTNPNPRNVPLHLAKGVEKIPSLINVTAP